MTNGKKIAADIIWSFLIGMIAGVSPFIFMQILPALLNPSLYVKPSSLWPLILTGILVGAITAIIFCKTFQNTAPKDIFFYALGIPAVLIATVSNLSTDFHARSEVAEVKANTSAMILTPAEFETIDGTFEPIARPKSDTTGRLFSFKAWAGETEEQSSFILAGPETYYVIIGEYNNAGDAWKEHDKLKNMKLGTERYEPKQLNVLQLNNRQYFLVYGTYTSKINAERVYKLLRINDPELNARLVSVVPGGT